MRRPLLLGPLLLGGCAGDDAATPATCPTAGAIDVDYTPSNGVTLPSPGQACLRVSAMELLIDTDENSITIGTEPSIPLSSLNVGPNQVAVLKLEGLAVDSDASVRATGSRALVIADATGEGAPSTNGNGIGGAGGSAGRIRINYAGWTSDDPALLGLFPAASATSGPLGTPP